MTKQRWTRIQRLYEEALEQPRGKQSAYLKRVCGDDADLYEEVASLLDVELHSLFAGSAVDAVGLPDVLSAEGERVGPWRLARRLGAGGMGTVYLAERADGQFEQTAALKLVKRGMDTDAVLARFQAERQILARLEHPHIARLLDGGVGEDGRPYFAMEYVAGEPITDYCDARALPVDARLQLFEQVCEAVTYAHQNLIVHRDLKPSNILVSEGDGGPVVKLLDFGIAKLLAEDDHGLQTRTGQRVLTPAYAAPEQLRGEPVTTATDVYGLGVVLYELLTGRRPSADEATSSTNGAAATHTAALRPSTAVARTEQTEAGGTRHTVTPVGVAHARSTEPERLRRRLRGDLDTIVLQALHPDAARRYASAEGLGGDLRRHLDGLPVQARPDTPGYRLRKFVERHRTGVLASLGVVLLLVTLVGFYTARLAAERDRARTEADKAQEVSAFLAGLFESADPAESRGADVTARELLAEGAERIEAELAGQPEVQAQMYGTIGNVYVALGLYDEAEASLRRSLTLLDAMRADPLAVARAQADLGDLYVERSDFDAADSLLTLALATQRARYTEPHEDLARTLQSYGDLLIERGDYPDAEAPYNEALAIQRALHGTDHATVASLLAALGVSYDRMGRHEDAARTHDESLAMRRRLHGNLHPATTESLREASTSHRRIDNYARAEALIREAIALDSQLVGLEHPNLGEDYYQYASLLSDMGRFDEATAMFERSLAVDRATLGENHPYIAITLGDLGQVRHRAGDREGAIRYFRRGVAMARRELPPDHPQLAGLLHKLGEALSFTDNREEAERLIREALTITQARFGDDHVQVLSIRSALGSFFTRVGRHDEAIALHRDVLERRRRTQGEESAITARSYYNLAAALRVKGTEEALAEAQTVADEAVERYRAIFPEESREVGYALLEQADVLRASGDVAAARLVYQEAGRIFRAALGPEHPILERIARALADLR